ncbi:hypothetical protein DH31_12055 [Bacillus cereus]|nr:hypothetical protein DH31_12055 [Bacillus cereus]
MPIRPINLVNPSVAYCSGSLNTTKQPLLCSSLLMSMRVINVFNVIQWTRVLDANSPNFRFGMRIITTFPSRIHLAKSTSFFGSCEKISCKVSLPKKSSNLFNTASALLPNSSLSPQDNSSSANLLFPSWSNSSIAFTRNDSSSRILLILNKEPPDALAAAFK